MWAYGRQDLKLPEHEFWLLTPREYRALVNRQAYHDDQLDYRAGVIASAAVNAFGGKKSNGKPFDAFDFFPHLRKSSSITTSSSAPKQAQTTEEQIMAMQSWMVVFQQHANAGSLPVNPPKFLPGKSEILSEAAAV